MCVYVYICDKSACLHTSLNVGVLVQPDHFMYHILQKPVKGDLTVQIHVIPAGGGCVTAGRLIKTLHFTLAQILSATQARARSHSHTHAHMQRHRFIHLSNHTSPYSNANIQTHTYTRIHTQARAHTHNLID
jgi:hypothetical protein